MPGVRIDGGDVLAVYEAARDAVARARGGRGPDVHRGRHVPRRAARDRRRPDVYIDAERVEEERRRECVGRFEGYLQRRGLLADELRDAIRARGDAAHARRDRAGGGRADPDPALLFTPAFASPPRSFDHDLAELRRILAGE